MLNAGAQQTLQCHSQTSTNSHLSLQRPLFLSQHMVYTCTFTLISTFPNSHLSTIEMATKVHPNSQNNLLTINHWLIKDVYQNPFFTAKGHETWSVPSVVGLCFCLVSVLLINTRVHFILILLILILIMLIVHAFVCYGKHFLKNRNVAAPKTSKCYITPLPPYSGHLSTMVTFLCPQGDRCGEVQLYYQ